MFSFTFPVIPFVTSPTHLIHYFGRYYTVQYLTPTYIPSSPPPLFLTQKTTYICQDMRSDG